MTKELFAMMLHAIGYNKKGRWKRSESRNHYCVSFEDTDTIERWNVAVNKGFAKMIVIKEYKSIYYTITERGMRHIFDTYPIDRIGRRCNARSLNGIICGCFAKGTTGKCNRHRNKTDG